MTNNDRQEQTAMNSLLEMDNYGNLPFFTKTGELLNY